MTSANVTNIAALAMMANPTVEKTKSTDANFADVMNNSSNSRESVKMDVKSSNNSTVKQTNASVNDSYEANKSDVKASNITKTDDNQKIDSEVIEKLEEKFDEFVDEVKEVIEEAFDVSEDDIENAMILLNLSQTDLLNSSNVSNLVGEIIQVEDSISLILDENVSDAMSHITEAANFMLEESGLDVDTFVELIDSANKIDVSMLEPVDSNVDITELGVDLTVVNESVDVESANIAEATNTFVGEQSVENEVNAAIEEDVNIVANENVIVKQEIPVKDEAVKLEDKDTVDLKASQDEPVKLDIEVDSKTETYSGESQENNSSAKDDTARDNVLARTNIQATVNNTVNAPIQEFTVNTEANTYEAPINAQEVIDQIVEHAKTTINKEVSSMEMVLNPEHLGKVYLQVTEKAGTVKAQIHIQNQELKEALTNQMVIMRDNLEKAGVKVEAIEVSVGTHEFEKNLEENMHNEQNNAEQYEEHNSNMRRNRNININDLDEMIDDITDEEALIAQIMMDNGNTLNYQA